MRLFANLIPAGFSAAAEGFSTVITSVQQFASMTSIVPGLLARPRVPFASGTATNPSVLLLLSTASEV
jgi:hypothetical protein